MAKKKLSAKVLTNTASFWVIAPEQLYELIESGALDGDWFDWVDRLDILEKKVKKSGGAVFNTGADGTYKVEISD